MKPRMLLLELWGVGDLAIASPFIQAASARFDVTVLCKSYGYDLQRAFWPAGRVFPYQAPWTRFHGKYRIWKWDWRALSRLASRLRAESFDLAVSARWDPREHFLMFASGASERVGFGRLGSEAFLTRSLELGYPLRHRVKLWQAVANSLGFEFQEMTKSRARAEGAEPDGTRVVLHTGAAQPVRVWPLDRYRKVALELRALGFEVVVVCDPNQTDWWRTEGGEPQVLVFSAIAELIRLLRSSSLFVGNDSGPGHLAALCGVPVFTIFGPQLPQWFHPMHEDVEWMEGGACPHKPCFDYCRFSSPHCIEHVSVDEVIGRLKGQLSRLGLLPLARVGKSTLTANMDVTEGPVRGPTGPSFRSRHPLRILQVFNRYQLPGGEEFSVERIAGDLEAAGHEVIRFRKETLAWSVLGRPPRWRQPFLMWNHPQILQELRAMHDQRQPQVWLLHNVLPVISLGIYRLALQLGVPVIQWLHNYRPVSPGGALAIGSTGLDPADRLLILREMLAGTWNGRLATAWLGACLALARDRGYYNSVAAWVAVSERMHQLFATAGIPAERLFTLRHSWNAGSELPIQVAGDYFLFLGRIIETKGIRFLVDLWRRPELAGVKLVVAGEGPLCESLRELAPPNVSWVGFVQGRAKRELLARCQAVLLPSIWDEPLSTIAYEAYEYSKPILVSDRGGMAEVVRHRETGFVLPAGEAEPWAEAILQLSCNPGLSALLGRQGRSWLLDNVNVDTWNQGFDRIVSTLVERGCLGIPSATPGPSKVL